MTSDSLQASQLFNPLFKRYPNAKRWVVAYSGGVDSHVLLHLCQKFLSSQSLPLGYSNLPVLLAIHVNHQLQDKADVWVKHCAQQARQLDVDLIVQPVVIDKQPQQSLEEQARLARYGVFEAFLEPGDVLLQGHHSNDQAETFLLRVLRGSGSLGLGAMPRGRALAGADLYRPMLDVPRSAIEGYAKQYGLQWVEDPSNQQQQYDRNFLRSEIMPDLQRRWPQYLQNFTRSARLSAESAQLNQELAQIDWQQLKLEGSEAGLSIEGLKALSVPRCKNLLRFWLAQLQLPLPTEVQLIEVIASVINAQQDAQPQLVWPGCEVYRFRGELITQVAMAKFESREYRWPVGRALEGDNMSALPLQGAGELSVTPSTGSGLKLDLSKELLVRFRQGGEIIRPCGRGGSRKVKKLLQEHAIPYWLRDRVPLLYYQDQLVAVADIVVAEGWQAGSHEQGMGIHWKRP
ncbi:MAG: tRNA(Ile)-lysidine synthase [Pseudohongiellaceae bacterium]